MVAASKYVGASKEVGSVPCLSKSDTSWRKGGLKSTIIVSLDAYSGDVRCYAKYSAALAKLCCVSDAREPRVGLAAPC